jgi:acyl-CoA reductase-like NAD-dependent aldehyde dehydrogenase
VSQASLTVLPFVDGAASESRCAKRAEVFNPSRGTRLFDIPAGCAADVEDAVVSARRAFDQGGWSNAAPSHKKGALHRFADLIHAHSTALDALDGEEMGKPISTAAFNASGAASLMRFYAEAADKVMGDVYGSDQCSFVTQRRVPRGVVAAIVPWNFPTYNAVMKVAPALAAGNSVVLKPSELSSRSALRLAQLALEAGLPPGVLNVVPGLGETVGRALALHMGVDMVAFTGSTRVGKRMLQYAGRSNMKSVLAECGGKSPHVVFADGVDLDAASAMIAAFLLTNQGQVCSIGSRLLVQRSIEQVLIEKVAAHASRIVMGDALDPKTTFGPLVSARQCERVMRYIEDARRDGAELIAGGRRALLESRGYFVEPTIFRSVSPASRLAQEEIFGPVLAVFPFEDEAEALRLANDTKYGLAAYVWTASLSTGMRMAKGIRAPVIVNASAPRGEGPGHAFSAEPFGSSGVGTEGGLAGLESYLHRQLIWINHD